MAEYDDATEEVPPPVAAQSPAIQTFQEAFTAPVAQQWSQEVGARLNDYFTRRDIADTNTAAGERFVSDLDAFKSGLISGVQNDPFFAHTALDIVPPTLDAFAAAMPNAPEDVAAHNEALTRHIQGEIATAAVTALAETHEGAARAMLGDERIKSLLGEATGLLDTYIGAQANARRVDHEAQVEQLQARAAHAADTAATGYLSGLVNPVSNTVQFPDRWNQSVLADPALPPPVKAGVLGIYDRLRTGGDIERSDPFVITDAIRRAADGAPPPAGEIAAHIGQDLTLTDGLALMRRLSLSPAAHAEAQNLQQTLDLVRQQIAPIDSGAAGAAAYGRFVNWFLPEYMRQGPSALNPKADNWMLNPEVPGNPIARFQPTGDDLIGIEPLASRANRAGVARPSLGQIFSGGGRAASGPVRDEVPLRPAPAGYHYEGGGNLIPDNTSAPIRGPFYGVEPVTNDQAINPAGVDRDAAGHLLREVRTDSGIKALTPTEIRQSTTAPTPRPAAALTDRQQEEFQNTGRIPTRGVRSPRRRR
jgi:hypothetical protein